MVNLEWEKIVRYKSKERVREMNMLKYLMHLNKISLWNLSIRVTNIHQQHLKFLKYFLSLLIYSWYAMSFICEIFNLFINFYVANSSAPRSKISHTSHVHHSLLKFIDKFVTILPVILNRLKEEQNRSKAIFRVAFSMLSHQSRFYFLFLLEIFQCIINLHTY